MDFIVKTYTIKSIHHVVEIATTLPDSWFRGHSKVFGNLTPGIFRYNYDELIQAEYHMIESFKRQAPSLSPDVPTQEEYISWLFLIQHFRTPTRLLDRTESALIALYFVVENDLNEDGELWVMNPQRLNGMSLMSSGFPTLANKMVLFLFHEPFQAELPFSPEKIWEKTDKPLAIQPPMNFSRMVAQQSVFTIHPKPFGGKTITELLTDEKHLVRYIIPAEYKGRLFKDLKSLGIKHHTLFPDLDSLSRSIKEKETDNFAYSTPAPPKCGGVYE